jgi:hypothetical protein
MGRDVHDPVREAWLQQQNWSRTANRLKSRIARFRLASLVLTLCGAILGAAATQLEIDAASADASRVVAVGAAFAVAMVPTLRSVFDKGVISDWTRIRAVSETLKANVYTYLAGVSPYRGPDRQAVLAGHLRKVLSEGEDLKRYLPVDPPTAAPLPAVDDVPSYVRVRLAGQIERYYRPKALEMTQRITVSRNVQIGLAAAGAALGVLTLVPAVHTVAWIGVVTTAGTAVAAHAAESRFVYQFIEYSRTVQQLDHLLDGYVQDVQAAGPRTEEADDKLVAECERVISIQNEAWMVKWRSD